MLKLLLLRGSKSPQAQRYIDKFTRTRDRLLKQLLEKKKTVSEKTRLRLRVLDEIKQSIALREKFDVQKQAVRKRLEAVAQAVNTGKNLTDPDAPWCTNP